MTESIEPYRHHHKDGSLWIVGQTRDGQADGYWEWFRKDGTKLRSGHFSKGVQVGEWTTYDKTGKVYKVTTIKKTAASAAGPLTDASLPR
ncbi:hypothetical protein ASC75_01720 [Aminobacter sp. DSM 101952]|uniref:toxin-antitoxin system YwqK family antitoxin n=1 Tax=Aminobacter sp. DSM 101952 TaxID=2735891 RepID=UPI0006FF1330|nr:hypothetical protein [Aminobacter sp. DSM 101952]KQU76367.1 hypothetical protein ASC75_01720 [Aminobacter sp. DSM 101952]